MSMKLNNQQLAAIRLLASGVRSKTAAEKVGVTPETISRWRKIPEFIATMNEIQGEAHDDTRGALRSLQNEAVNAVKDLLVNSDTPPKVRLEAALSVFDLTEIREESCRAVGPCDAKAVQSHAALKGYAYEQKLLGQG